MQTGKPVPSRFQWDVTLVVIASTFILVRLVRIALIWITQPGPNYEQSTFWIALPILSVIFGWVCRDLHYKQWQMLIMGAIGFAAGIYYWIGPREVANLIYVPVYILIMNLGFFAPVWIYNLRKKP